MGCPASGRRVAPVERSHSLSQVARCDWRRAGDYLRPCFLVCVFLDGTHYPGPTARYGSLTRHLKDAASLDRSSPCDRRGQSSTADHSGCKRTICRLGSPSGRRTMRDITDQHFDRTLKTTSMAISL